MFKKSIITLTVHFFFFNAFVIAETPPFEIPASFNPIGSGARALAMGGAYMSACSDGTAASWNPACLCLLKDYELAVMGSFMYRKEDNSFSKKQVLSNVGRISEWDINYMGAVIPINYFQRYMVLSMNYQQLYDLNREWEFINVQKDGIDHWKYRQSGALSAIEIAYAIQLNTWLSFGITCNFWDNSLSQNTWKQQSHRIKKEWPPSEYHATESYTFKGTNFNLGMIYKIRYNLYVGAIIKTPFQATIKYQENTISTVYTFKTIVNPFSTAKTYELNMPLSYGMGMLYHISDQLHISADLYCTRWDQFFQTDEQGLELFPVTSDPISEVDIDPTVQVRLGAEYLWKYNHDYYIPIRGGAFYDPAPGDQHSDDFWGFTIGSGLTKRHQFSIDVAYQYRHGNDIQTVDLSHLGFSQDVSEHSLVFSLIYYWKADFWEKANKDEQLYKKVFPENI
jgi:hypothetical protein